MFKSICTNCQHELLQLFTNCPHCHAVLHWEEPGKNTSDQLVPDCLIHRYQGSDLLEPAAFLKSGKTNFKVALPTTIGVKQVTVAKDEVFALDHSVLNAITELRQARCATMTDYDNKIGAYWQQLNFYSK